MKTSGPIVLLDADDFLFDLRTPMRKIFAAGGKVMAEEGWDFAGGDPELDRWWKQEVNKQPGFVRNLELLPGVAEGLSSLRDLVDSLGGAVKVVTAPCYEVDFWVNERFQALHDLGFDKHSVDFTFDKAGVDGDILFDDGPHNCKAFVSGRAYRIRKAGLFVHPWTESSIHAMEHAGVDVVRDWGQILLQVIHYDRWYV